MRSPTRRGAPHRAPARLGRGAADAAGSREVLAQVAGGPSPTRQQTLGSNVEDFGQVEHGHLVEGRTEQPANWGTVRGLAVYIAAAADGGGASRLWFRDRRCGEPWSGSWGDGSVARGGCPHSKRSHCSTRPTPRTPHDRWGRSWASQPLGSSPSRPPAWFCCRVRWREHPYLSRGARVGATTTGTRLRAASGGPDRHPWEQRGPARRSTPCFGCGTGGAARLSGAWRPGVDSGLTGLSKASNRASWR